jgi:hypothetical protein
MHSFTHINKILVIDYSAQNNLSFWIVRLRNINKIEYKKIKTIIKDNLLVTITSIMIIFIIKYFVKN